LRLANPSPEVQWTKRNECKRGLLLDVWWCETVTRARGT
jgi:hypothetical protein